MKSLIPHPKQREIIQSEKRFKAIRAGRKGGKTLLEVENISYKAISSIKRLNIFQKEFKTGRKILYIAPTRIQAETIVWSQLKSRLHGVGVPNESKLVMKVPNEDGEISYIYVGGWENRENYRGLTDVIHITVDEVDTLTNFFSSWKDIFRPLFIDTRGTADFIGTPKKENPNLKRLEKEFSQDENSACFHFTSFDNPHIPVEELNLMKEEYKGDMESYRQEVLAEHIEHTGALFNYSSIVDVFSNTIDKDEKKYLIVDIADDGTDKTKFSFWEGLEEYRRETFERLNTEGIIAKIREYASSDRIPFSHIAVDAIGVGAGVATSSLLDGIIGFKSSYGAIKTDMNIVLPPNAGILSTNSLTTDYKNLRCQCIFTLADLVNNHKIASRISGISKEYIIEELNTYQDVSKGDGRRMATMKEDIKASLGRSPDDSDTWIMRMYFEIMKRVIPDKGIEDNRISETQINQFEINKTNFINQSNK